MDATRHQWKIVRLPDGGGRWLIAHWCEACHISTPIEITSHPKEDTPEIKRDQVSKSYFALDPKVAECRGTTDSVRS